MEVKNSNNLEISNLVKSNKFEGYKNAIEKEQNKHTFIQSFKHSGIKWNISKDRNEKSVNPIMDSDYVSVSSIRKNDKEVSAIVSHKLGYKISLEEKKEVLQDKYVKNFLQAKSYNYIVAKFAQLKMAFLSQTLSSLGVTIPELQKMQKKAIDSAREDNSLLFEENEYNAEMISIIGGSGKKLQKELSIMNEIRTQLITQMNNLGISDFYNEERLLETKIKVCKKIQEEFLKEKELLAYERDLNYLNKDLVKTKKKGILGN